MNVPQNSILLELRERHEKIAECTIFSVYGYQWDLFPGVYAPSLTQGAALYVDWLEFPKGGEFCEIGCGTGYLSVMAALSGCKRVLATDILPSAIENTLCNIKRHGVGDVVDVYQSDLFDQIKSSEKFDLIFWNSNFIDAEADTSLGDLSVALYDEGYQTHKRYLVDVFNHLNPNGQAFLGFTDLGNVERLWSMANDLGISLSIVRAAHVETQSHSLTYHLIKVTRGS